MAEAQRRIDRTLVERYRELPVATVSDSMFRISSLGARIRPLHAGGTVLAGPALTVRTRPGDNLMIHKAIDVALPGDVIVVDAGGDLTNALVGELMLSYARTRGVAGFVLNGAVRDLKWIKSNDLPVYAAGVTHRGPYKDGPGEVNLPISVDGTVIEAGDLVLGDDDGVLVVPIDEAAALLERATEKHLAELRQVEAIRQGRNARGWVDETLRARGCEME
ncbi:RraA family protein [Rhodoplanes roseus]|uniref:RraA family protein n=1 Tax=Rhodoplanes roseus TaxID=29409 RepID=UPI001FE1A12F|nr:RraA family protein [Rhodoplanes roseus]